MSAGGGAVEAAAASPAASACGPSAPERAIPTGSPARPGRSARSPRRRARRSWPRRRTARRRGWRRGRAGGRPPDPRRGRASRRGTLCCGTGRPRRACRRARRRTARRTRPPCCGRGRWPAPPRRGRSGRPSGRTCRRPGRARPRAWSMALSRWYPSGSRSTGWPPPRHSHYQPRRLPGTFLSAVGGGASRAGSTQQALSGAGTFGRARAPGRRPVLGAPQS